jgi:hypothetical protein
MQSPHAAATDVPEEVFCGDEDDDEGVQPASAATAARPIAADTTIEWGTTRGMGDLSNGFAAIAARPPEKRPSCFARVSPEERSAKHAPS